MLPQKYFLLCAFAAIGSIFLLLSSAYSATLIDSTQTSKAIFLFYAVVIALMFFFFYVLNARSCLCFSVSILDACLFFLLFYVMLNRYCIQPIYGYSIRFQELTGLVLLYLLLRWLPIRFYPFLFLCIAAGGFLQIVVSVFQLVHLSPSRNANFLITGNFYNSGGFAGYLSLILIYSIWLYANRKIFIDTILLEIRNKVYVAVMPPLFTYLPLMSLIGCLIILPTLRSRSAFLAGVAGFGLVWYREGLGSLKKMGVKLSIKRVAVCAILLIAVLFSIYPCIIEMEGGNMVKHQFQSPSNGQALEWLKMQF